MQIQNPKKKIDRRKRSELTRCENHASVVHRFAYEAICRNSSRNTRVWRRQRNGQMACIDPVLDIIHPPPKFSRWQNIYMFSSLEMRQLNFISSYISWTHNTVRWRFVMNWLMITDHYRHFWCHRCPIKFNAHWNSVGLSAKNSSNN